MFDSVLLEVPRAERRRRKLTLVATLAGESLVIAALVAVPLLYLDAIPGMSVHAQVLNVPLGQAPTLHPDQRPDLGGGNSHGPFVGVPTPIVRNMSPALPYGPARPDFVGETIPELPYTGPSGCCGLPGGDPNGFVPPPRQVRGPEKLVLSRLDPGMIVHRVEPAYPQQAKLIRVQGEVILHAVIAKDGGVESLRVVSGHPMLVGAALDAVRQWRFRPYYLNGSPIEVEAQVTVRFVLGN